MSDFVGFLLLYFCLSPVYAALASVSFDYFALKLQAADSAIEVFIRRLGFPVTLLLGGKLHTMEGILFGRNTDSSLNYLQSLQTQERLRWNRAVQIALSCIPLPLLAKGLLESRHPERITCLILFMVGYVFTLIICLRFGHRLGQIEDDESMLDNSRRLSK
jgi:hypothetical protein